MEGVTWYVPPNEITWGNCIDGPIALQLWVCVCVSLSLSGLLSLCVVGEKEVGAMGDISKSSVPY